MFDAAALASKSLTTEQYLTLVIPQTSIPEQYLTLVIPQTLNPEQHLAIHGWMLPHVICCCAYERVCSACLHRGRSEGEIICILLLAHQDVDFRGHTCKISWLTSGTNPALTRIFAELRM